VIIKVNTRDLLLNANIVFALLQTKLFTAVFMLVDHSRDALMQRPYKVLVMVM